MRDPRSIIVAVASPAGRSPRGIVRASGPGLIEAMSGILESTPALAAVSASPSVPRPGSEAAPEKVAHARGATPAGATLAARSATAVRVPMGGDRTLPALALTFGAPRSYTGEDVVELLLPGSPPLLERVAGALVQALEESGHPAGRAGPGEFTARAFLSGRIDLAQAEGVAAVIAARSDAELKAARTLLDGRLGALADAWCRRTAALLARVEAGIDFVDQEDVVAVSCGRVRDEARAIGAEIDDRLGAVAGQERRTGLPKVVLAGAPNAGKSTLFNALLGRVRAVHAPVAGTTRDALVESMTIARPEGALELLLVDLPGLEKSSEGPKDGAAPPSIAEAMRRTALAGLSASDLVIHCRSIDDRGPPDGPRSAWLGNAPLVEVATRIDLDPAAPLAPGVIGTSAVEGTGLDLLRRRIAEHLSRGGPPLDAEVVALSHRARAALTSASAAFAAAIEALADDPSHGAPTRPELVAAALRRALDRLGEVAGHVDSDDVLGLVFSTFCIGK